ncbi:MAG: hypothetical protein CMJ92_06960 [Planctomycetes bacterium]|nr:hypothetical protein [Planctomycetota bacterium]
MIRSTFTGIASAAALFAVSEPFDPPVAMADSTKAYCTLAWHEETVKRMHMAVPMIEGSCTFSQYQGNVYVDDFNYYKFAFPAAEQGKTYQRDNKSERISFTRDGQYTLNVFWQKPAREPGGY